MNVHVVEQFQFVNNVSFFDDFIRIQFFIIQFVE